MTNGDPIGCYALLLRKERTVNPKAHYGRAAASTLAALTELRYFRVPRKSSRAGRRELILTTAKKELLTAICSAFGRLDEASNPADPAVILAKRFLLNGLAEMRLIDALDDAAILNSLIGVPRQ